VGNLFGTDWTLPCDANSRGPFFCSNREVVVVEDTPTLIRGLERAFSRERQMRLRLLLTIYITVLVTRGRHFGARESV
jgi:hypothetical protein